MYRQSELVERHEAMVKTRKEVMERTVIQEADVALARAASLREGDAMLEQFCTLPQHARKDVSPVDVVEPLGTSACIGKILPWVEGRHAATLPANPTVYTVGAPQFPPRHRFSSVLMWGCLWLCFFLSFFFLSFRSMTPSWPPPSRNWQCLRW